MQKTMMPLAMTIQTSDFEDISLPDTIVKEDDDEPKDIVLDNYYDMIAFDDNSDYEQNNEENVMGQATVNNTTNTNSIVIKPDPDAINDNSIPQTDTVMDKPHLTKIDMADMDNAVTLPDIINNKLTNQEVFFAPAAHTRP